MHKMGSLLSSCKRQQSSREITLLMIGLDNAGKTCTAKHLLGEQTHDVVPTVGFSTVHLKHRKFGITIYDLGGGARIRSIWKNYYALVHGVIFVVDATDIQRIEECKKEIIGVLQDSRIAGKPVLMLVNKQDIETAVNEMELCSLLDLESLVNEQKCATRVEATSALYGEDGKKDSGIEMGFNWLIGHIAKNFKDLHERVEKEAAEQKENELKEQAERLERVRRIREERERLEAEQSRKEDNEIENSSDDDVVFGNPFRPITQIQEELAKKDLKSNIATVSDMLPGATVIHVSPTHIMQSEVERPETHYAVSDSTTELAQSPQSVTKKEKKMPSSTELESDVANGVVFVGALPPLHKDKECDIVDSRKKIKKKAKKRFKNRVVPGEVGSLDSVQFSKQELPPLRHITSNQDPWFRCPETLVHSSAHYDKPIIDCAAESKTAEGKINWALAEELVPCEDKSRHPTKN